MINSVITIGEFLLLHSITTSCHIANLKKYWGITMLLSEDDLYPQEIIYGMCARLLALIFVNAFEIENLRKQIEKLQN